MTFKDKKWGPYKKWADHIHVYFTAAEKQVYILRAKPFTPILIKWWNFLFSLAAFMHYIQQVWQSPQNLTTEQLTGENNGLLRCMR